MISVFVLLQNDHHNKSRYHPSLCIVTKFLFLVITFKIYSQKKKKRFTLLATFKYIIQYY